MKALKLVSVFPRGAQPPGMERYDRPNENFVLVARSPFRAARLFFLDSWLPTPDFYISRLVVADVDVSGETPRLVNSKVVYESKSAACRIERRRTFTTTTAK